MIESLERLGLDPDRVRRQRDAMAGIGKAYLTTAASEDRAPDVEMRLFAAATNLRRAAANSLLLGETEAALRFFDAAAGAYMEAGSTYGLFLRNLGGEEASMAPIRWQPKIEEPRFAGDVFWLWNAEVITEATSWGKSEQAGWLRRKLDQYRTERVGLLGLPVGTYLEIFDALLLSQRGGEELLREAIFPMLGAFASAIRRSHSDRYHWSRLAVPFHPVEPDILAILVAMDKALAARQSSLRRILTGLPLGDAPLTFLSGALRQYHAWRTEKE